MAKCTACGKFLSPSSTGAAACSICPFLFHKACVALAENSSIRKDWVCPECTKKQRKGDNSSTPVRGSSDSVVPPLLAVADEAHDPVRHSQCYVAPPIVDSEVKAMRQELAQYMAEEREFRNEFRTTIASVIERVTGLEKRLEVLEAKEVALSKMPALNLEEVKELQQTVYQLRTQLNDRDQDALLTDLDIGHLPEENGENLVHSVTLLAAKLGVTLEERDIVFAERVGSVDVRSVRSGGGDRESSDGVVGRPRAAARRVIVRLTRRRLRDEFLKAARVRRSITSADIALPGPPRRIYVNERLTRQNRLLFFKVREECRKRQWRYAWTKGGRLYARQTDGKPVYPIRVEADFSRIFGIDIV